MADSSSGGVAERKRRSSLVGFFIRLLKEKPLGTVGAVITLLMLVAGIFSDFMTPYGMNEIGAGPGLLPPSPGYWLGTDHLGRDILSRIIFGARISMIVGLGASAISTLISTPIGMLCGYIGGKFDMIVQRVVDTFMCFPGLILMMVVITTVGPGLWQVVAVMGVREGIIMTRIVRGATLSTKENVYVAAAVAIGCSPTRVLTRHILPNIMAPIIIIFTVAVPEMILIEASLSFLGFGIPPPQPSWGGMLSGSGRSYMFLSPWMAVWPGLALSIVVYGVNMFGDALRDLLDPRLRGGAGRYGTKAKKETTAKSKRG